MGGRNPHPCVCGHRGVHGPGEVLWIDGTPCTRYRPARRAEPLRVVTAYTDRGNKEGLWFDLSASTADRG
jgi:hypothetical protein